MEKEFVRYNWKEYKEMLERYDYTEEQLEAVRLIRETAEEVTKDQYDFLVQTGIISRTRKLKKIRTLYVFEDKVWYLEHFSHRYEYLGFFVNNEEN